MNSIFCAGTGQYYYIFEQQHFAIDVDFKSFLFFITHTYTGSITQAKIENFSPFLKMLLVQFFSPFDV